MILGEELPDLGVRSKLGRLQLEVGEGDLGAAEVAAAAAAGAAVEPGRVAAHVPQGEDGHGWLVGIIYWCFP